MPNIIDKPGDHRKLLKQLLGRTQGTLRVASAYITDTDLLLGSTREVRLLTLWSPEDIVFGATSLKSLRTLLKNGVECRVLNSPPKLHAKVYIIGKHRALVTSANLTGRALDENIEVGALLNGGAIPKLARWFDNCWESDQTEILTPNMISKMSEQTAALQKKIRRLRSLVKPDTPAPVREKWPVIKLPSSVSYFFCNTDRRHSSEAEKLMKARNFVAAWETFDFTDHMQRVRPGDIVLMYANSAGIIGIGKAKRIGKKKEAYQTLLPGKPGRVLEVDDKEWRVPVKWLRWVEPQNACPWKPHLNQNLCRCVLRTLPGSTDPSMEAL